MHDIEMNLKQPVLLHEAVVLDFYIQLSLVVIFAHKEIHLQEMIERYNNNENVIDVVMQIFQQQIKDGLTCA